MKTNCVTPFFYFVLAVTFFTACSKTDAPPVTPQTSTLSYILANGTQTTIFHSAVVKAGLDSVFNGSSIFTLFVPNDLACKQSGFPQDTINAFSSDQARNWVLYQTYAGTVLNFESFIGKKEVKLVMANGDSVFVSGDSNRTYVNGFQFVNSEALATNGLMLAMQNVLVAPTQNLIQILGSDSSLSLLEAAIQQSTPFPDSLSTRLATGGPYTFFAPVNDAFRNRGYNSPADLALANPDSLRNLILSGMIPQRLFSYDIPDSSTFTTSGDSTLQFILSGIQTSVRILNHDSSVNIIYNNTMAVNGVLFKIDGLLDR